MRLQSLPGQLTSFLLNELWVANHITIWYTDTCTYNIQLFKPKSAHGRDVNSIASSVHCDMFLTPTLAASDTFFNKTAIFFSFLDVHWSTSQLISCWVCGKQRTHTHTHICTHITYWKWVLTKGIERKNQNTVIKVEMILAKSCYFELCCISTKMLEDGWQNA